MIPSTISEDESKDFAKETASTSAETEDMRLSKVSQAYDRGNKGYLDSTELQLRQMDTSNKGYLEADKVYELMQQLRDEQKKSMTLKKVVIALSVFALLLALANIGTAYAAAILAKDTSVNPNGDLAPVGAMFSGERLVGTTAKTKGKAVQLEPADDNATRNLDVNVTNVGTSFRLLKSDVDSVFDELCNEWGNQWRSMDAWDGSRVGCVTGAESENLNHCGFQTNLKFFREPYLRGPTNEIIVFRFNAYRGDWRYGKVDISCGLSDGASDWCIVDNLSCDQVCDVCLSGSSDYQYWWCNAEDADVDPEYCGCVPGASECLPADQGQPFCTSSCYTPSGGGGVAA